MCENSSAEPHNVFLSRAGLMERYGRQKSAVDAHTRRVGFPSQCAPGLWRLDHVMAHEDRLAAAGAMAVSPGDLPAVSDAAEADEVDVLARRRPGRQPKRAA